MERDETIMTAALTHLFRCSIKNQDRETSTHEQTTLTRKCRKVLSVYLWTRAMFSWRSVAAVQSASVFNGLHICRRRFSTRDVHWKSIVVLEGFVTNNSNVDELHKTHKPWNITEIPQWWWFEQKVLFYGSPAITHDMSACWIYCSTNDESR